jgi:ABC-type Fe3+/spermidine/putrescine transport system ATPase subunit
MMNDEPTIVFEHVGKRLGPQFALADLCLEVPRGGTLALFGPSGCGKTTTLRLIAGFEQPDSGAIRIDGKTVGTARRQTPPHRRGIGMVFQDLALWPHMNVRRHLAFVLESRKMNKADQKRRIVQSLDRVALAAKAQAYPHQLSGGEQQRLALACALAVEPSVLLMDEPLASLDANLRSTLLHEIRSLIKSSQMTSVYVTHDWHEALFLADRIAMMQHGRIERIVTPKEAHGFEENAISLDSRRNACGTGPGI